MPSTINADNGVSSGSAGLKSTADSSGVLALQTNGTTAISIDASQAVSFTNQPTYSGGTANGVAYLNGSKVLTTGSALVFDGSNLGVGTSSPSAKLQSLSGAVEPFRFRSSSAGWNYMAIGHVTSGDLAYIGDGASTISSGSNNDLGIQVKASGGLVVATGGSAAAKMTLDSSGNLGLGVTPSADTLGGKKFEIGFAGNVIQGYQAANLLMYNNATFNSGWKYSNTAGVAYYQQTGSQHIWYNAPSGTAGNAITFTQAMTLNASGYLAIGDQTSPTTRVDIRGTSANVASTVQIIGTGVSTLLLGQNADGGVIRGQGGNNCITFWTGGVGDTAASGSGSERARINSSGTLLAYGSSTVRTVANCVAAFGAGAQTNAISINSYDDSGKQFVMSNNNGNTTVFSGNGTAGVNLFLNGSSWSAFSDERIKDIIEPITDAANKVASLRTVIGKYKTDEEGVRRPFLIAQDVQSVLPEAVKVSEDEIGTLNLSYTDMIPLLTAAIKEQQAIITQLQADVAALKGA